jgi:hypothetical protein
MLTEAVLAELIGGVWLSTLAPVNETQNQYLLADRKLAQSAACSQQFADGAASLLVAEAWPVLRLWWATAYHGRHGETTGAS